jgi:hypothetical protein
MTTSRLVGQLLWLPEADDPLVWLKEVAPQQAAIEALTWVLAQARPPRTIKIGKPRLIYSLATTVRTGRLTVTGRELVLGESGIVLTVDYNVVAANGLSWPQGTRAVAAWVGFDTVMDNNGYQYLRLDHLSRSDASPDPPNGSRGTCVTAFYPALAPDTRNLTFSAEPVIMDIVKFFTGGRGRGAAAAPEIVAEKVSLPIVLPVAPS